MSDDINRLRELAGIKQEPVKSKTKLDEGVIGSMQEVRHVSERNDPNWDDYFNNDREAGIEEPEEDLPSYHETDPDDIFARGDRVDYNDDETGGEIDFDDLEEPLDYELAKRGEYKGDGRYDSRVQDYEYRKKKSARDAGQYSRVPEGAQDELDSLASGMEEDVLVSKEKRIVDDAKSMVQRGMDLDSVVMSLASEYGLSTEEQFELYNIVVNGDSGMSQDARDALDDAQERRMSRKTPDFSDMVEDEDRETMRGRQSWEMGDTEESHTVDWEEVKKAAADAAETIFGHVDHNAIEGMIDDAKYDLDSSANTEDAVQVVINKMRSDESVEEEAKPDYIDLDDDGDTEESMKKAAKDKEEVEEDFDNGYDKQIEVDADGYFPRGAHNAVNKDAGPSSAKHGDNPMQKKMDVTESKQIHSDLASNYRLFKKS